MLVDADTLRVELEEKLVFAAATLQQSQQRATVELQVAADEANRRQATLELKLSEEVAACKSLERDLADNDAALNPIVLVEVLSESSEAYDRGQKFAHYRRIPSLREYVLVSQHEQRIEVFPSNEYDHDLDGEFQR